ncbi:hypothetical protein Tco_1158390, partial [Tanacetum coccineum]
MKKDNAKQAAYDEKLVPSDDRVKIGKSNLRMDPSVTQREETYQVVLDIIKNTPFYNAFLIFADAPKIYMQQFWLTITKVKKSSFYQFDIDTRRVKLMLRYFEKFLIFAQKFQIKLITVSLKSEDVRSCPIPVDDDEVLDRLTFINKGDIYQVYGKPIP